MTHEDKKMSGLCPDVAAWSAYLDGDRVSNIDIDNHLRDCVACQQTVHGLQEQIAAFAKFDDSNVLELPMRLQWSSMRDQLQRVLPRQSDVETETRRGARLSLSALLSKLRSHFSWGVPLAAAALLLIWQQMPQQNIGSEMGSRKQAKPVASAYAAVVRAEQIYITAIDGLQQAVLDTRSAAGETAVANVTAQVIIEAGLRDIDDIIQRCRRTLRNSPEDFAVHRMLLSAYQRKVELLADLLDEPS